MSFSKILLINSKFFQFEKIKEKYVNLNPTKHIQPLNSFCEWVIHVSGKM